MEKEVDVNPELPEKIPFSQRVLENPILLLIGGLLVMFLIYTLWGVVEILHLPSSNLP
jgi:hypothetical protein